MRIPPSSLRSLIHLCHLCRRESERELESEKERDIESEKTKKIIQIRFVVAAAAIFAVTGCENSQLFPPPPPNNSATFQLIFWSANTDTLCFWPAPTLVSFALLSIRFFEIPISMLGGFAAPS